MGRYILWRKVLSFKRALVLIATALCTVSGTADSLSSPQTQSPNTTSISTPSNDTGSAAVADKVLLLIAKPQIQANEQALVKKYIEHYSSPAGIKWLQTVLNRAHPWAGFILQTAAAHGVPEELAWLPIIESTFVPSAVSRSGAVGLWQFMSNSIAPFGIRVNEWMDERRDFWKASDAAIRKLKENYTYFKDWPLALAAYNAGLGAVQKACVRAGRRDYWHLSANGHLKSETINYVPKFMAVVQVLANAETYGLELDLASSPEWTRIPLNNSVDLRVLAKHAGLNEGELLLANSELSWGVSPAKSGYMLKVRKEDEQKILATLQRKDVAFMNYHLHKIAWGDTLYALSRHFDISIEMIEQANPGIQARSLKLGSIVLIPAFKEVSAFRRTTQNNPQVRWDGRYKVLPGDTLWSLALRYNTDPEELAAKNGMTLSSVLSIGKILKTPIISREE
jgi:membrane-bound lytic murein transglycosylase D